MTVAEWLKDLQTRLTEPEDHVRLIAVSEILRAFQALGEAVGKGRGRLAPEILEAMGNSEDAEVSRALRNVNKICEGWQAMEEAAS